MIGFGKVVTLLPILLLSLSSASPTRDLINKWRFLTALSTEEATGVIASVHDLFGTEIFTQLRSPLWRELQSYSTPERVLARAISRNRTDLVRLLLDSSFQFDRKKLHKALWARLKEGIPDMEAMEHFLLLFDTVDETILAPLDSDWILAQETESVVSILKLLVEYCFQVKAEVHDLLVDLVNYGHILPPELLSIVIKDVNLYSLLSAISKESNSVRLSVAEMVAEQHPNFLDNVKIYDPVLQEHLPLVALFTKFYLEPSLSKEDKSKWNELYLKATKGITSFDDLNQVLRSLCRLPDLRSPFIDGFIKNGAYLPSIDMETGSFAVFNAILARNPDLAIHLLKQKPTHSTAHLHTIHKYYGVNMMQAVLELEMIYVLRAISENILGSESIIITLYPWQAKQINFASLFNVPFEIDSSVFEVVDEEIPDLKASLGLYAADELAQQPVYYLTPALYYQYGFWILRSLNLSAIWIRLPSSNLPAIMRSNPKSDSVIIEELYQPRNIQLPYLKIYK